MTVQIKENINFEREEYKALCKEMKEILTLEKELKAKKAELRELIIKKSGGTRMEYGIHVKIKRVNGSVDYKMIAQNKLSEEELEEASIFFRKPDLEYFEVRSY